MHLNTRQAARAMEMPLLHFKSQIRQSGYAPWPRRTLDRFTRALTPTVLPGLTRLSLPDLAAALAVVPAPLLGLLPAALRWDRWPTSDAPVAQNPARLPLPTPPPQYLWKDPYHKRLTAVRRHVGLPAAEASAYALERRVLRQAHLPWPQACAALRLGAGGLTELLTELGWQRWPKAD